MSETENLVRMFYKDPTKVSLPLKFPFRAALFDKDGVLMDTEKTYYDADLEAIARFGRRVGEFTWEGHLQLAGKKGSERFEVYKRDFGVTCSLQEFNQFRRKIYNGVFERDGIPVPEGVREFVELSKLAGVRMAVVTGASKASTEDTLRRTGLLASFEQVVTSDDVKKGKPDPECYLLGASMLGILPGQCLAIGDAVNDFIACRAAGIKVVGVVNSSTLSLSDD